MDSRTFTEGPKSSDDTGVSNGDDTVRHCYPGDLRGHLCNIREKVVMAWRSLRPDGSLKQEKCGHCKRVEHKLSCMMGVVQDQRLSTSQWVNLCSSVKAGLIERERRMKEVEKHAKAET